MKKKKISITTLKVKSFVTGIPLSRGAQAHEENSVQALGRLYGGITGDHSIPIGPIGKSMGDPGTDGANSVAQECVTLVQGPMCAFM